MSIAFSKSYYSHCIYFVKLNIDYFNQSIKIIKENFLQTILSVLKVGFCRFRDLCGSIKR